jgi:hypothetical protein
MSRQETEFFVKTRFLGRLRLAADLYLAVTDLDRVAAQAAHFVAGPEGVAAAEVEFPAVVGAGEPAAVQVAAAQVGPGVGADGADGDELVVEPGQEDGG